MAFSQQQPQQPLVVIIGAGPSGLAAADRLTSAALSMTPPMSPPVKVIILESAERIGGRTCSVRLQSNPNVTVDVGGQWVGAKQDALLRTVRDLGLVLHPQYCRGNRVLQLRNVISTYRGLIPNASLAVLVDAQCILFLLSIMQFVLFLSDGVISMFPFLLRCGGGCRWLRRWLDGMTVEALSRRLMWTIGGKALVAIVAQGLFGAEPCDISVLSFCKYAMASGGVEKMSEIGPGSVQAWTVVGGMQQVSEGLAKRSENRGATIMYGRRVVGIAKKRLSSSSSSNDSSTNMTPPPFLLTTTADATTSNSNRSNNNNNNNNISMQNTITVTCESGEIFEAAHVILAIPPPLAHSITFTPLLPLNRMNFMEKSTMGGIIKSLVVYDSPFWREAGFSGEVICDTSVGGNGGIGIISVDDTAADGNTLGGSSASGPAFNIFDNCLPSSGNSRAQISAPLSTERQGAATGVTVTACQDASSLIPCLVVFINGQRAREWSGRPAEERKQAVLKQLSRWFGEKALSPVEYVEKDWVADPHTRGCPIASYGRAVLTQYGLTEQLRQPCYEETSMESVPFHRIHFAGTEASRISTGFVDGAIRSGWIAAEEVLDDLTLNRNRRRHYKSSGEEVGMVSSSGSGGGGGHDNGGKQSLLEK